MTSSNAQLDVEDDEVFLRSLIRPEEELRQPFGGYRWFRSPNVIDLVAYRRKRRAAEGNAS
jgi:hypothetical protein